MMQLGEHSHYSDLLWAGCRPEQPWGPLSLLYKGHKVFPRPKATRTWCWPPTFF